MPGLRGGGADITPETDRKPDKPLAAHAEAA